MDFSEILKKIEEMPRSHLALYYGVFYLLVIMGGYTFVYSPSSSKLEKLTREFNTVRSKLVQSKGVARDIKSFGKELAKLKYELKVASTMLPKKDEVPALLKQISDLGTQSGLEFLLFKPRPEKKQGFYAQVPVELRFEGTFHNVCVFFDSISKLSRIVNVTDLNIASPKEKSGYVTVNTRCVATTFRYIEKVGKDASK